VSLLDQEFEKKRDIVKEVTNKADQTPRMRNGVDSNATHRSSVISASPLTGTLSEVKTLTTTMRK
jgi:hypothetical protein